MANVKKVNICMFGTFDITVNKKSVLTKGIRQQGFNKLLVFFLLNQGRVFEINTLIEKVWPGREYQDINSIIRTRIFRLKKQLAELAPAFDFSLEFTRGGYSFTYDPKNVSLDTEAFEDLCARIFAGNQAVSSGGKTDEDVVQLCSEAMRIYQSGFLTETAFDGGWAEPYRQNYRRMWFRVFGIFADLCNRAGDYGEIISICNEVLRFEDTEEHVHEVYMNALYNAGFYQDALRHYEVIKAAPVHGEAFANSPKLRELQRLILRETGNNKLVDEEELEHVITEITEDEEAVVYEKDVFLKHCSVLRMHSERSIYRPYICILETLGYSTDDGLVKKLSDISYLTEMAKTVFRKSDILCEWNDRQVLVLMACNQNFGPEKLTQRLKLAILRDNLAPGEASGSDAYLTERSYYLPLNIRFMPIGTNIA